MNRLPACGAGRSLRILSRQRHAAAAAAAASGRPGHPQQRQQRWAGATRGFGQASDALSERSSAVTALEKSCYFKIDFKIDEDAMVYEAVQRFAAYNIGALAVTNKEGKVVGIISERDYVCKIALLGRQSQTTKVKEIATMGANIIVAKTDDSVHECMRKMLARDIRHLPVMEEATGNVVGLLSIKDLIKEVALEKEELIAKIRDFKLGRGGFFEHT